MGGGKKATAGDAARNGEEDVDEAAPKPRTGPYESDLEYLQDMFQVCAAMFLAPTRFALALLTLCDVSFDDMYH